jgi:hypothetical protein
MGWVAHHSGACRNVFGDHAASTNDRIITEGNAWNNDGAAPSSDVASDSNRTAELETGLSFSRISRMVCRQHLNIGPNLGVVADGDFD